MNENKGIAQEIWKISILYPKTSKEFYHHMKFRKSIVNSVLYKKLYLNISQYSQETPLLEPLFKKVY